MENKIKTFKDLKKKILIANTSVDKLDMKDVTLTYNCHEDGLIRINPYKKSNVLLSIHLNERGDATNVISTVHKGKQYQTELDWADNFSLKAVIYNPRYLSSDVTEYYMAMLSEALRPKHESFDEYLERANSSIYKVIPYINHVMVGGLYTSSKGRYSYLIDRHMRLLRLIHLIQPEQKLRSTVLVDKIEKIVSAHPKGWLESIFGYDYTEDEFDLMGDAARGCCDIFSRWNYNQFQKLIEWYPKLAERNNDFIKKHPTFGSNLATTGQ